MNVRAAAIALLFTVFTSTQMQGQQGTPAPTITSQSSRYSITVTTKLVSLDVVVTDATGNPVEGLTQKDFTVLEGKQPQVIRSFEPPQAHFFPKSVSIQSTAQLDRDAPDAAVSIIVLDEANTTFEDEAFARYSIKRYLSTQPEHLTQPTELVAIDITHFMVLRDYTTSKAEILNALNHHLAAYPWHLTAGWEAQRFSKSFKALSEVAKAVAGHPGHKNMIWIGQGFPTLDLTNADSATIDSIESAIEAAANQLRDARITLYTVDPSGLSVEESTDQDGMLSGTDPFGTSVSFDAMAKATGGLALYGRNDVDNLIGESMRDGNHFYTFTYRPEPGETADKFRAIHVVIDKPGLKATTRQGYYVQPADATPVVKTAEEQKVEVDTDLLEASANQMVYDGLSLRVQADPQRANSFLLHVPSVALDWQHDTDQPTTHLSLLVATFDRKGKLIKREAKLLTVRIKLKDNPSEADPSINLETSVDTARAARIRFVVRSGTTGRIGATNVTCTSAGICNPSQSD